MAPRKPKAKVNTEPTMTNTPPETVGTDWRDPNFKPADDDNGLEARMWRIAQRQLGIKK